MINFNKPRYWYHLSNSLYELHISIDPKKEYNNYNSDPNESEIPRFCVSPSIEKCLVALPYYFSEQYNVYRTLNKEIAVPAEDVFDKNVTHEGWFIDPVNIVLIGTIDFDVIPKAEKREYHSVCQYMSIKHSKELLKKLHSLKKKNIYLFNPIENQIAA